MNAFEIAGLVALLAMAAAIVLLLRRDRSRQGDAGLVETWKVGFDASPIATIVRQNGVFMSTATTPLCAFSAPETRPTYWKWAPAKITPERQPDGRLTADIFKDCAETLKAGRRSVTRD